MKYHYDKVTLRVCSASVRLDGERLRVGRMSAPPLRYFFLVASAPGESIIRTPYMIHRTSEFLRRSLYPYWRDPVIIIIVISTGCETRNPNGFSKRRPLLPPSCSVANNFLATVPRRINRSSGRASPPAGPGLADNLFDLYVSRTDLFPTHRKTCSAPQRQIGSPPARLPLHV